MYAFLHKQQKVGIVVYQQCSSATTTSFRKVGVRCWIERFDFKSENNEQGKCEKAPNQDVKHRKTCEDSAHFCSLYAFPEDYISKLKRNVEVKEIIFYIF